jgi:hypothetical protein
MTRPRNPFWRKRTFALSKDGTEFVATFHRKGKRVEVKVERFDEAGLVALGALLDAWNEDGWTVVVCDA